MTFKELLRVFLVNDPVIGPMVAGRVYDTYMPELTPDKLYPCLTYTIVSRGHVGDLQGNTGLYKPKIQLVAWSLKSSDVEAIAARLMELEGKQTLAAGDGSVSLEWLFADDETDDAAPPQEMDDRAVRYSTVDCVFWYRKPRVVLA